MKKAKHYLQSKTILLNGAVILAGLATQALASLPPESDTAVWTGIGVAALNAILRKYTKQPLSLAS